MPAPFTTVVADDSPTALAAVLEAVRAAPELELIGHAVDGQGAIARIRELQPDVALLDVVMPDTTGPEVVRLLRAERSPTTFVLMSTLSEPELALQAAMAGAASFVDKAGGPERIAAMAVVMARRWDGLR